MISLSPGTRIVVATMPVDFRRGAESLAALAREVLKADPYEGVVVIFRSRRADRVKLVAWDQSGLVMAWKGLNGSNFHWPPIVFGTMRLSSEQAMVLQMDEERSRLEESVERMTFLAANKEALIEKLVQTVKDLKALKFGKRSEKMSPDQLALALEDVIITTDALQAQLERNDAEIEAITGPATPALEKAARKRARAWRAARVLAGGSAGEGGSHCA